MKKLFAILLFSLLFAFSCKEHKQVVNSGRLQHDQVFAKKRDTSIGQSYNKAKTPISDLKAKTRTPEIKSESRKNLFNLNSISLQSIVSNDILNEGIIVQKPGFCQSKEAKKVINDSIKIPPQVREKINKRHHAADLEFFWGIRALILGIFGSIIFIIGFSHSWWFNVAIFDIPIIIIVAEILSIIIIVALYAGVIFSIFGLVGKKMAEPISEKDDIEKRHNTASRESFWGLIAFIIGIIGAVGFGLTIAGAPFSPVDPIAQLILGILIFIALLGLIYGPIFIIIGLIGIIKTNIEKRNLEIKEYYEEKDKKREQLNK